MSLITIIFLISIGLIFIFSIKSYIVYKSKLKEALFDKFLLIENKFRLTGHSFIFFTLILSISALIHETHSDCFHPDDNVFTTIQRSTDFSNETPNQTPIHDVVGNKTDSIFSLVFIDKSKSISNTSNPEFYYRNSNWYLSAIDELETDEHVRQNYEFQGYNNEEQPTPLELYKVKAAYLVHQLKKEENFKTKVYSFSEDIKEIFDYPKDKSIIKILKNIKQSSRETKDVNSNFVYVLRKVRDFIEQKSKKSLPNYKLRLVIFSDLLHDTDGGKGQKGSQIDKKLKKDKRKINELTRSEIFGNQKKEILELLVYISKFELITNIILLSKDEEPTENSFSFWLGKLFKDIFPIKNIHIVGLETNNIFMKANLFPEEYLDFYYKTQNKDTLYSSIKLGNKGSSYQISLGEMKNSGFSKYSLSYNVCNSNGKVLTKENDKPVEGTLSPNGRFENINNAQRGGEIQFSFNGYPITNPEKIPPLNLFDLNSREMYSFKIRFVKVLSSDIKNLIFYLATFGILSLLLFTFFFPYGFINLKTTWESNQDKRIINSGIENIETKVNLISDEIKKLQEILAKSNSEKKVNNNGKPSSNANS